MMKEILSFKNAILAAGVVACCGATLQAQDLMWASHIAINSSSPGSIWTNSGKQVAVDDFGNTYATGWFDGDSVLITSTATTSVALWKTIFSSLNREGYLVKYDARGKIAWSKRIGGVFMDQTSGPTIDHSGNVYITGGMDNTVDFNEGGTGGVRTANGEKDIFIAKYNKDGNFIWAKNYGGRSTESGSFIYLDTLGNLFISGGVLSDTIDFNPGGTGGLLTPGGGSWTTKNFIAKYDTAGNYKWATILGNTTAVYSSITGNFAVSLSGETYISGYLYGSVILGTGQNTLTLEPDAGSSSTGFVAKYKANGNPEWVLKTQTARVRGIVADYNGNPIFTGNFSGSTAVPFDLNFGSGSALFTPVGGFGSDIFIAKYKADGTYVWAKNMGSASGDLGDDIAVDKANNIYTLSRYTGTANFKPEGGGSAILVKADSSSRYNLAITKHKPDGTFYWVRSIGGTGSFSPGGIAVNNMGRISVTGTGNNVDIDPGTDTLIFRRLPTTLPNTTGTDGFVVQLSCNDTTASFLTETLECGAPYTLNGEIYTTDGTYTQHRPNTAGCDSVITFELVYSGLNPEVTIDVDTLSTIATYNKYQWIKDGNLIGGATNAKLTVSENGKYQVIVTNQFGCSDTSEVYPVTNQSSVNDLNGIGQQIKIFPNPAKNKIYLQSPVKVDITLAGIDGRILASIQNATSLSVKEWANGIYFLRITDKEGRLIRVEKIVKE